MKMKLSVLSRFLHLVDWPYTVSPSQVYLNHGSCLCKAELQDAIVEVVPMVVELLKDVPENIQNIPVALGHGK